MIKDSKILTVSYGTFSCTLEGFDDSFTTMKAIAEYFRDLAADDRYFGAEPPTPDAEMLARIAEREIDRRVQAHEDDGKIVLRAEEATPAALLTNVDDVADVQDAAPQTAEMPEPVDHAEPVETAEAPAEEITEQPVVPKSQGLTAPMPAVEVKAEAVEDAEDEIAPILEEQADEPAEDVVDAAEDQIEEIVETAQDAEETAQDLVVGTAEGVAEGIEVEEENSDSSEETHVETLADFADEADDETADIEAARAAEVSHPDPDSVAAKLSRIRSVVAQSEQPYGDTDYSEDEHASDFLETNLADLDAALAADDAAELNAPNVLETAEDLIEDVAEDDVENVSEVADDDVDDILANISALSGDITEAATQEADEDAATEDAPLELSATDMVEADAIDPIQDTLAQLMADALPEGENAEADEDDDEVDEAPRALNARVVKMKTADVEAALASGELRPADQGQDTVNLFTDEDGSEIESTLSEAEEDELQRELAEVEADFAPDLAEDLAEDEDEGDDDHIEVEAQSTEDVAEEDIEDTAEDDIENDIEEEVHAEAEVDEETQDDDLADKSDDFETALDDAAAASARGVDRLQAVEKTSDVSRIFDEVDQQRDEPGSSERRNAIQHLRAAVAATRADQNAGVDITKDKDDSAYRSDLADVVRPRRPRAGGATRSQRPGMERPAPLKLVAEQRIDTPHQPVRPRRISTADISDMAPAGNADTDDTFADFAEEAGAGSLPELLEAAAAYMADVEGRPQFSRPMLMGKLKEVEGESFSREDGLRSFGQLLRQGKLQKLKGGRFAVTDETEFRAPARNVG